MEAAGGLGVALGLSACLVLTMALFISSRSTACERLNIDAAAGVSINSGWNGAYLPVFFKTIRAGSRMPTGRAVAISIAQ